MEWWWIAVIIVLYLINKLSKKPAYLQLKPLRSHPDPHISPEKIVFAFDLHEVVVMPKQLEMMRLLFTTGEGLSLCKCFLNFELTVFTVKTVLKFFVEDFLSKKGIVAEELFFLIADKYPELSAKANFFAEVANSFEPDPHTLLVLRQLKEKKYKIFLFSNIGKRFFTAMKKKYSWMDNYFDDFMCAAKEDGYLKKPNHNYYELFHRRFMEGDDRLVVFVDDKVSNLKGAVECSAGDKFHPILFYSGSDLLSTLKNWGIIE